MGAHASSGAGSFVTRVATSSQFEGVCLALIILNALVLAADLQQQGLKIAGRLGYERTGMPKALPAGSSDPAFLAAELAFGVAFGLEVLVKIAGLRTKYLCDPWAWLDMMIVALMGLSRLETALVINPSVARMFRLFKVVRVLRPVKRMKNLHTLVLLVATLRSSAGILVSSMCLLLVVLVFDALLLNQVLIEFYFLEDAFPLDERREVYRHFGTMMTALFSMFELTLGNWPTVSRLLYENVNQWFLVFTIVHKLTVGFAVIGVVNGVFMQETFRVAQQDDMVMWRQAANARKIHAARMRRLMDVADVNADAGLDLGEFRAIFEDEDLKMWLTALDFVPQDVDRVFRMMDDGSGTLSIDQIVSGVARLKGPARNLDLQTVMCDNTDLQRLCREALLARRP